jgi:hypothetical protein
MENWLFNVRGLENYFKEEGSFHLATFTKV